ncbi:ArdC-like ssDNA-binding domain-containing protein [Bacteroides sp. An269]|uniref:zincin-like metallopeptidase domain-containing protein n=1 Tax=Bacteroides sp. An269 TaxID=1965613 RepID=UPI000B36FFE6|nr:ArdC-like ssDNA-binding domain-containing protein [Bacteroides sp. An269]OUO85221.1 DNA mismatch repair protein MutS [Bacteroides sp. An269]
MSKDKSPQEKAAVEREKELLSGALNGAAISGGYWLNASGRTAPRFYPKGPEVSPFNALILGMHADRGGYKTARYFSFNEAKKHGEAVLQGEKGVPFHWYKWEKYVNRNDPSDTMSREDYLQLDKEERKQYKGVRNREIRILFNVDQTTLPDSIPETYRALLESHGGINDRGNLKAEERQLRNAVNHFVAQIKENLVPIRKDGTGTPRYDTAKDAVYMPDQKHFSSYPDYVQELVRQVASATGHRQRLAREGMVMQGGKAPSEDAVKYERLVAELAAGVKMMDFGLPAKMSAESLPLVEYWTQELQENPTLLEAIETDVNNAVEVMRKAERGEKIEYATLLDHKRTTELREKQKPQVDSRESAILIDIIRKGGMGVDSRNFASPAEKQAFLEKFNLGFYDKKVEEALLKVHDEDPEVMEIAFTEAVHYGTQMAESCKEYMPAEWNTKGSYTVSDSLKGIPDRSTKEMVIVRDKQTGIVDVVLPAGALEGGHVAFPDGDKRPYCLTPDEVMNAQERSERGAKAVTNNLPGFSKTRIDSALRAQGATFVRFFNKDGLLGFRPDDSYFEGKEVTTAKLEGKELRTLSYIDVSEAVENATSVQFDRIQMLRDDDGRWALYLKPQGETSFSVYPDKEDVNRFFTTIKQGQQEASAEVRRSLANKYYALAQNRPELKVDLFAGPAENADLSKIKRVNIFRTKDERILCAPVIDGIEKVQPRLVTPQQWQRMWAAEDMAEYKTCLAAKLFADVLQQANAQAQSQESHQGEQTRIAFDANAKGQPFTPAMQEQYDQLKGKHPDAVLLFRTGDNYLAYKEDAQTASRILGLDVVHGDKADIVSFPFGDLDTHLPKLIRAGQRVAICDQLENPEQTISKENEVRMGRGR